MAKKKKARKWSNVNVPNEPVTLTDREVAIRAEADKLRGMGRDEKGEQLKPKTMRELAQEYKGLLEEEGFETLAQKTRSIQYEAYERVIRDELTKIEEMTGQDMWRGENMTFSPKNILIPVITDRAALRKWIEDTGQQDILEIPGPKLKSIVTEAMDTDGAATLTAEERHALKPGEPSSGQPPPGVSVFIRKGVNPREV